MQEFLRRGIQASDNPIRTILKMQHSYPQFGCIIRTMAWKSPINIKLSRERGLLDEKRFYALLSEKCNYMDEENVRMFYLGLVKLMTQELRDNNLIRLPHIGDFALTSLRPQVKLNGKRKDGSYIYSMIKPTHVLRFKPRDAWAKYFKLKAPIPQDADMITR